MGVSSTVTATSLSLVVVMGTVYRHGPAESGGTTMSCEKVLPKVCAKVCAQRAKSQGTRGYGDIAANGET